MIDLNVNSVQGVALMSALALAIIGFLFLGGPALWLYLGIAAIVVLLGYGVLVRVIDHVTGRGGL